MRRAPPRESPAAAVPRTAAIEPLPVAEPSDCSVRVASGTLRLVERRTQALRRAGQAVLRQGVGRTAQLRQGEADVQADAHVSLQLGFDARER